MRSGITALGRAMAFLPPSLRRSLRDDVRDGRYIQHLHLTHLTSSEDVAASNHTMHRRIYLMQQGVSSEALNVAAVPLTLPIASMVMPHVRMSRKTSYWRTC